MYFLLYIWIVCYFGILWSIKPLIKKEKKPPPIQTWTCFVHLIKNHHPITSIPKKPHPAALRNRGNFQSLTKQSPLIVYWVHRTSSKNNTVYRTDSRINPQSSSTIKALVVLSLSKRMDRSFLTQKHANNSTWHSHKDKRNSCKERQVSAFNVWQKDIPKPICFTPCNNENCSGGVQQKSHKPVWNHNLLKMQIKSYTRKQ